ncbi:MAG: InlB B-repeat-containing protein [Collinsella aerofaciens]
MYFTVNSADSKDYVNYSAGGGVYRYTLGDAEATQIYDAAGHYQHCDSPVIADASGNLYYINDSGTLFKLGAVESWTVAFNSNGGSACDTKFVATADGKLVKPADPTRDGYTFGGWYTDETCTQAYDFSTPVTADLTLYAKWTKNAVNPGGNGGSGTNGGNGGAGNGSGAGTGTGSGSGTKGQQAGGAVAPVISRRPRRRCRPRPRPRTTSPTRRTPISPTRRTRRSLTRSLTRRTASPTKVRFQVRYGCCFHDYC